MNTMVYVNNIVDGIVGLGLMVVAGAIGIPLLIWMVVQVLKIIFHDFEDADDRNTYKF